MNASEQRGLAHRLVQDAAMLVRLAAGLTDDLADRVRRAAYRLQAEADALRLKQGLPFEDEFMAPINTAEEGKRRQSNREKVLQFLKARGVATNHELRQVGGARAMARVWELQKQGYSIQTRQKFGGTWLVSYHDDSKSTSNPTASS